MGRARRRAQGLGDDQKCAGRFTPKLPPSEAKVDDAKLIYAAWLAGCIDGLAAASDVEINLMTCEFVHRCARALRKLKILEDDFAARSDFAECFGAEASREVQCAEIQTSEMRNSVGAWACGATSRCGPRRRRSQSQKRASLMASTSGAAGLLSSSWVSAALKRDGSGASWGRVLQEDAGCAVVSGRIDSRSAAV